MRAIIDSVSTFLSTVSVGEKFWHIVYRSGRPHRVVGPITFIGITFPGDADRADPTISFRQVSCREKQMPLKKLLEQCREVFLSGAMARKCMKTQLREHEELGTSLDAEVTFLLDSGQR